jgi:GxxExxY protein
MVDVEKYNELTGKIIKCAMNVHNGLGNGFQEIIYQKALAIELKDAGIPFKREVEMDIYYRNQYIGKRRADFLVEDNIIIELKAVSELNDLHMNQTINYLEAYKLEVGLLINFGENRLKFKRYLNGKL